MIESRIHLLSALKVLRAIPVDVMMGANRLFELVADNKSRTFRGGTPGEQHDARTGIWESGLSMELSDGDHHGSAQQD